MDEEDTDPGPGIACELVVFIVKKCRCLWQSKREKGIKEEVLRTGAEGKEEEEPLSKNFIRETRRGRKKKRCCRIVS